MAEIIDTDSQRDRQAPEGTTPVELATAKGNKYVVYAVGDERDADQSLKASDFQPDESRGHAVNWRPENEWKQTDQATRDQVYIDRYELRDDGEWIYIYRLTFFPTKQGFYAFKDGTGDVYHKFVADGWHDYSIDYNSRDPTIKYVWWSNLP